MGSQAFRRTRKLCRAQQSSITRSRTPSFHRRIPVFHDATALPTAVHVLDAQPTLVQGLVRRLLLHRALLATGLLPRHEDLHVGQRERQEPQILQQPAPGGYRRRCGLGDPLVMAAAAVRVAQKEDGEEGIDQQDIFDRVISFLAAITRFLFSRLLGADDAPFGPVMGTRGESGAATGAAPPGAASSSSGATRVAAAVSATPSRWARAVSERAGASPRARSAASSAGKRR